MNSNKSMGNRFESDFCEWLSHFGFWATNLPQSAFGQPFDILAAKHGKPYAIDCKVCSHEGFALIRMEENQDLSMTLWEQCGNGPGWFAVRCKELVYMFKHETILELQKTRSVLPFEEFPHYGITAGEWVMGCE